MDCDQRRTKRSRLRSTEKKKIDISLGNDMSDDDSKREDVASRARLSATTIALQHVSLQEKQCLNHSTDLHHSEINPALRSLSQPQEHTPSTSFLAHPSFHQKGIPSPSFSFGPLKAQSMLHPGPTSPNTRKKKAAPAHCDGEEAASSGDTNSSLKGLELSVRSTGLPLHGPRPLHHSGAVIPKPSSRQVEPGERNSLLQSHFHHTNAAIIPGHQPLTSSNKAPRTFTEKSASSLSAYVSASEKDTNSSNPFAPVNVTATHVPTVAHGLLHTQKQISTSQKDNFTSSLSWTIPTDRTCRLLHDSSSACTFPYSGIHPANQCRLNNTESPDFRRSPPGWPSNHYTSPNRISHAALTASRKRKRGWPTLPPPAYIYTHTSNPDFNIFQGILLYPELCFALAANLPINDLLSLYAISKDFHTIIDSRFATVILNQSARKCPESSRIFPFRCYKYLCRPDPAPRIPHPHPAKHAAGEIRKVPSFRWLKMILFREQACHEIVTIMAEDGVPLPRRCELALKRMWFLMDIPDNARRIGYMHTKKLVEDLDLYFMMCFIVKLEMRFNDPVGPHRCYGLRKMVLAQRGLLPLLRVLKRTALPTKYEVMKMWITTKHKLSPEEEGLPLFDTSADEIGKLRMEYRGEKSTHDTGKACNVLMRPDQLVLREIIRRKMVFSKHFLRCLLWGYVDIVTLKDYPPRQWERSVDNLTEGYEDDENQHGGNWAISGGEKESLLDLAIEKPISMLVTPRHTREGSRGRTRKEDAFLEECVKWFHKEL